MSAFYLYDLCDGNDYGDLMQARTRAEALEKLRCMWADMPEADRKRRESFMCYELTCNESDQEIVTWESLDMCSKSWMIAGYDERGLLVFSDVGFTSYDAAMSAAEAELEAWPAVMVSGYTNGYYEPLYVWRAA